MPIMHNLTQPNIRLVRQTNGNLPSRKSKKGRKSGNQGQLGLSSKSSVALAYSATERRARAKAVYLANGDVRVTHREYLFTVPGSVAFSSTSYSVNPGLSQVFPWLSGLASRYESYLLEDFRICFDTMKSASTDGRIMLAVDFDASDAPPVSVQEMMNNESAVDAAVWREALEYVAPVHDLRKFGVERYLRQGNVPAGGDIKTFDVGNILVATEGCANTSQLGHVYLEYTCLLRTPQFSASADALALSGLVVSGGVVSRTAIFGTAPTTSGGLPLQASGSTVTFNKVGQYLISVYLVGTGMGTTAPTVGGTAAVAASILSNFVAGNLPPGSSTAGVIAYFVTVTALGQTVTLDFTPTATTIASSRLTVASCAVALA